MHVHTWTVAGSRRSLKTRRAGSDSRHRERHDLLRAETLFEGPCAVVCGGPSRPDDHGRAGSGERRAERTVGKRPPNIGQTRRPGRARAGGRRAPRRRARPIPEARAAPSSAARPAVKAASRVRDLVGSAARDSAVSTRVSGTTADRHERHVVGDAGDAASHVRQTPPARAAARLSAVPLEVEPGREQTPRDRARRLQRARRRRGRARSTRRSNRGRAHAECDR